MLNTRLDTMRTFTQRAAALLGLTLIGLGVLGLIPGITTNYDDMSFAGSDGGLLFGIFEGNVLHCVLRIGLGMLGLVAADRYDWSRMYIFGVGLGYLVMWGYGLAIDLDSGANFLALNDADIWGLGLVGGLASIGLVALTVMADEGRIGDHRVRAPRGQRALGGR